MGPSLDQGASYLAIICPFWRKRHASQEYGSKTSLCTVNIKSSLTSPPIQYLCASGVSPSYSLRSSPPVVSHGLVGYLERNGKAHTVVEPVHEGHDAVLSPNEILLRGY